MLFLSVEQVLAIHRRVIVEFGGEPSLRDRGLLESAVMMPAAGFGGRRLHRGTAEMAAAYLFHICKNHPFVDGNKRTALVAAEIFLKINGLSLEAGDDELEEIVLAVASSNATKQDVAVFLKRHIRRKKR